METVHHMGFGPLYQHRGHGLSHGTDIHLLLPLLIKAGLQIQQACIFQSILLQKTCKQRNGAPHPGGICLLIRHRCKKQAPGQLRMLQHQPAIPIHKCHGNGQSPLHIVHASSKQPFTGLQILPGFPGKHCRQCFQLAFAGAFPRLHIIGKRFKTAVLPGIYYIIVACEYNGPPRAPLYQPIGCGPFQVIPLKRIASRHLGMGCKIGLGIQLRLYVIRCRPLIFRIRHAGNRHQFFHIPVNSVLYFHHIRLHVT